MEVASLPQRLPAKEDDLSPEHKALLNQVREHKALAENTHKPHRDKWNEYYKLYRGYNKLKKAYREAANDRDGVILDAKRQWAAQLHIPYVFATVESVVPRVLSNDPTMRALPSIPDGREIAQKVERVFARDQKKIDYEITLQESARRGFIYGLGVQKTYWERKARKRTVTAESPHQRGKWIAQEQTQVLHEGPQAESVDIFDFFWQPSASRISNCKWAIHRLWLDYEDVVKRIQEGVWNPLDLDAVKRLGSESNYSDSWGERMALQHGVSQINRGPKHEVWEYHTQDRVVTVLDNQFVVQDAENPAYHCELPFQIFRPTLIPGEFVGVGEIEMIEQLQHELDVMRSQRRDAAMVALNRPLFVQDGYTEGNSITLGPGAINPVIGNPRESIMAIELGDIPASGYNEEAAIKSDIERVTGMSDPVMGGEGNSAASETATGMQLMINQANVRIALKAKNMTRETVRPAARQWLDLYKQHWIKQKQIRVPNPDSEQGFDFLEIGPEDFALIDDVEPDAGSTEPDNPMIRQESAMRVMNALTNHPVVEQRRLVVNYLKEHDIKDAESFLVPPGPSVEEVQGEFQQTVANIGEAVKLALVQHVGLQEDEAENLYATAAEAAFRTANQPEPQEGASNGGSIEG